MPMAFIRKSEHSYRTSRRMVEGLVVGQLPLLLSSAMLSSKNRALRVLYSGADWPVGLPGWGPKGPPQQGSPWAPFMLEEKYFKWLIFDELYDDDKTTSFNQRKTG